MSAIKMEVACGRWVFTGKSIPMELARKSWGDKYAAVRAANAAGFDVTSNFNVVPIEPHRGILPPEDNNTPWLTNQEPPRVKVKPVRRCPKCGDECPFNRYADEYLCPNNCGQTGEPPEHPCPDCGEEMEHVKGDTDGEDADGNRGHWVPAHWACECGHTEKHEPRDED